MLRLFSCLNHDQMFPSFRRHNDFMLLGAHAQNFQIVSRVGVPHDPACNPAERVTHGHILKGGRVVQCRPDRISILANNDKSYNSFMRLDAFQHFFNFNSFLARHLVVCKTDWNNIQAKLRKENYKNLHIIIT